MTMEGWIKLHRKALDHWLYNEKRPLTRREAWENMLLLCNHDAEKVLIKGELIECNRGQSIMSLKSWSNEFKWSIQQVRSFFSLLQKDSMINTEGLKYSTRITICNYDYYQNNQQTDNKLITNSKHSQNKLITTNKNVKNDKEVKEYKKRLLSEIEISDYPKLNNDYFEVAKAFKSLFKNNLVEAGSPTTILDKAKGTWIDDIRLMIEADKYTLDDLRAVYQFLQKDAFWKQNILSTATLRKQMPKLKLKIYNGSHQSNNKEGASWDELATAINDFFKK